MDLATADVTGTAVTGRPDDLVADLSAALEQLTTMLRRLPSGTALSLTTISTLRTLSQDGPQRLSDLATREGVTQPAMTQLVTRLERDGLAERLADPLDARVVRVGITRGGLDLLELRRATRADHVGRLVATLPAADREHIGAAVPALVRLAMSAPTGG
jgi:DNA-binding MarR family transcriptional regulator